MAKKRIKPEPEGPDLKAALKWGLRLLPVAILLVLGVVALQQVESFLIEDQRFQLGSTEESEDPDGNIRVQGVVHASAPRVRSVFSEDTGRSVYLLPVAERRRRLLAIDWVRNASVARIWPSRVDVSIEERAPVAFVQLSAGGRTRPALIDEDGVLLAQPPRSEYRLPVLIGINEEQTEETRAVLVRRMAALVRAVGPFAEQFSEIDVNDPDNLKVTQSVGGSAVVLWLGNENFRARIENFLAHYPEIQRRVPAATTFDLRIDDRITAIDGIGRGG